MRRSKVTARAPVVDGSIERVPVKGAMPLATVTMVEGKVPVPAMLGIVRVIPEPGTTTAARAAILNALKQAGAVHVWFAPPSAGARVVLDESVAPSAARRETAREAVTAMLKEAASRDPVRLAAVLEKALARAGL